MYSFKKGNNTNSNTNISSTIPAKKHSKKTHKPAILNSDRFFKSPFYKQLFTNLYKNDKNWIRNCKIQNIDKSIVKYTNKHLTSFQPPFQPPNTKHEYTDEIMIGLQYFKDWIKVGKKSNWILNKSEKRTLDEYSDTYLNTYYKYIKNEEIAATKGEMVLPYSTPIIAGVIMNGEHECKYEAFSEKIYELKSLDRYSSILYMLTSSPMAMVIKPRDVLAINFYYVLPNGEIIIGCRSIPSSVGLQAKIDKIGGRQAKKYIRAFSTLDLYHIRPWFSRNCNYSLVSCYSHFKMNGNIPNWVANQLISETPQILGSLRTYMDDNVGYLSKPGVLFIPVDMLKNIGIRFNIGQYLGTLKKRAILMYGNTNVDVESEVSLSSNSLSEMNFEFKSDSEDEEILLNEYKKPLIFRDLNSGDIRVLNSILMNGDDIIDKDINGIIRQLTPPNLDVIQTLDEIFQSSENIEMEDENVLKNEIIEDMDQISSNALEIADKNDGDEDDDVSENNTNSAHL